MGNKMKVRAKNGARIEITFREMSMFKWTFLVLITRVKMRFFWRTPFGLIWAKLKQKYHINPTFKSWRDIFDCARQQDKLRDIAWEGMLQSAVGFYEFWQVYYNALSDESKDRALLGLSSSGSFSDWEYMFLNSLAPRDKKFMETAARIALILGEKDGVSEEKLKEISRVASEQDLRIT